ELSLHGLDIERAQAAVVDWLAERGLGRAAITYRLRDWLFSRQRYWGEPFPIVFDDQGRAHAVPDDLLPVALPDVPNYQPRTFDQDDAESEPEPPLGRLPEWVSVDLDLGDGRKTYRREVNTMPNWAGSCWYYLRYLDPENSTTFCDPAVERFWLGPNENIPGDPGGVDLYVGGKEHAVLHLLYARFWHKVLFDLGHVSSSEPFRRYFGQGMIQAFAYRDHRGQPVPAAEVVDDGESCTWNGQSVTRELSKIGKSLKNVVTPDEIYSAYGADTFRVYEMSMGPLDVSRPWDTRSVVGSLRFLQRLWRNIVDEHTGECTVLETEPDLQTLRRLHHTIAAVTEHYQNLRFNTAIAKIIELNNVLTPMNRLPRSVAEALALLVAPVAPHIAEELWRRLGHSSTIAFAAFPVAEQEYLVEELVTCVVQIQGKVRERLEVPPGISEDELSALALGNDRVQAALHDRPVTKVIVRAPKLVSIVVG
ncbi:MAG: class I tRNA ligase family protein, partial [Angustibacter sp.]